MCWGKGEKGRVGSAQPEGLLAVGEVCHGLRGDQLLCDCSEPLLKKFLITLPSVVRLRQAARQ